MYIYIYIHLYLFIFTYIYIYICTYLFVLLCWLRSSVFPCVAMLGILRCTLPLKVESERLPRLVDPEFLLPESPIPLKNKECTTTPMTLSPFLGFLYEL